MPCQRNNVFVNEDYNLLSVMLTEKFGEGPEGGYENRPLHGVHSSIHVDKRSEPGFFPFVQPFTVFQKRKSVCFVSD